MFEQVVRNLLISISANNTSIHNMADQVSRGAYSQSIPSIALELVVSLNPEALNPKFTALDFKPYSLNPNS